MKLRFPIFDSPPTLHNVITLIVSGITAFFVVAFVLSAIVVYAPWLFLLIGPGAVLWGFYQGFWRIER